MADTDYSDAARRMSDAVMTHVHALGAVAVMGRWVACRLSDGGSDGVLYDTRGDAIRHQLHEQQCAYVQIGPDGMSPRQAENYLAYTRGLYAGGARMIDPDPVSPVPLIPMTYSARPGGIRR